MIKGINQEIPAKSLGYILICGGIIVVIVLLGIIPLYRYNAHRAEAIKKIRNQIAEQKGLAPVYQLLLDVAGKKDLHALPNPAKTRLARREVEKFQETFRTVAGRSALTTVSLVPDAKTMTGTSPSLLYLATLRGEFANFQRLLRGLGAVSYIDQIEEMNIRQYGDAMEFKIKIWIALAN